TGRRGGWGRPAGRAGIGRRVALPGVACVRGIARACRRGGRIRGDLIAIAPGAASAAQDEERQNRRDGQSRRGRGEGQAPARTDLLVRRHHGTVEGQLDRPHVNLLAGFGVHGPAGRGIGRGGEGGKLARRNQREILFLILLVGRGIREGGRGRGGRRRGVRGPRRSRRDLSRRGQERRRLFRGVGHVFLFFFRFRVFCFRRRGRLEGEGRRRRRRDRHGRRRDRDRLDA